MIMENSTSEPSLPPSTDLANLANLAQSVLTLDDPNRDFRLFYRWTDLTDRPIPFRHDGESNDEYTKTNWRRLRAVARMVLANNGQKTLDKTTQE